MDYTVIKFFCSVSHFLYGYCDCTSTVSPFVCKKPLSHSYMCLEYVGSSVVDCVICRCYCKHITHMAMLSTCHCKNSKTEVASEYADECINVVLVSLHSTAGTSPIY